MPTIAEEDLLFSFGRLGDLPTTSPQNYQSDIRDVDPLEFGPPNTQQGTHLFGDVVGAAFRLENSAVNAFEFLNKPKFEEQEGFDPFTEENLAGYELVAMAFVDVTSADEMFFVKQRLDQEWSDRAIIERAGASGMFALLAAGFFDPLILLPVGGQAATALKAGNILRSGLLTAWAATVGATATEAVLHANQYDRSLKETAWAIGGAAFLGGVMGGAFAGLSKAAKARAIADAERHVGDGVVGGGVDPLDVPIADEIIAAQDAGTPGGVLPAEVELLRVLGIKEGRTIFGFKLPGEFAARFGPWMRVVVRSRDAVSRSITAQMEAGPYTFLSHLAGRVSRTRVIREGGSSASDLVGTKATVALKGKAATKGIKGIANGTEVEIIGIPPAAGSNVAPKPPVVEGPAKVEKIPTDDRVPKGPSRFATDADVEAAEAVVTARIGEGTTAGDVLAELEGQGFIGTDAGGTFANRAASQADVDAATAAAEARFGPDATGDDILRELQERGFTTTPEGPIPKVAQPAFRVVDAEGKILGTAVKRDEAQAIANARNTPEGAVAEVPAPEPKPGDGSRVLVRAEVEESVPVSRVRGIPGQAVVEKIPRAVGAKAAVGTKRLASLSDINGAEATLEARLGDFTANDLRAELESQGFTGTDVGGAFPPRVATAEDVADAAAAAEARFGPDATGDDILEELQGRGFTRTPEGKIPKVAQPAYRVVGADGRVIGARATKAEAEALADVGELPAGTVVQIAGSKSAAAPAEDGFDASRLFLDEGEGVAPAKADAAGPVTIVRREGNHFIVRRTKEVLVRRSALKTIDQPEAVPRVVSEAEARSLAPDELAEELAVQTRVEQFHANLGRSLTATKDAWVRYRMRIAGKESTFANRRALSLATMRLAPRGAHNFSRPLTFLEFRKEVSIAMRAGDKHGLIEEAGEAARVWRAEVFEPLKDRALLGKILPAEIPLEDAAGYLTRVYNVEKILRFKDDFFNSIRPWLRSEHPNLNESELTRVMESIRDNITNAPSGRMYYQTHRIKEVSALQKRVFNIPDQLIEEWLENDINVIGSRYVRTVAPDAELAITFGDVGMTRAFEDMSRSFGIRSQNLSARTDLDAAAKGKAHLALSEERDSVFTDVGAMRDRIRGTFAMPENPNGFAVRSFRGARALNLLAQGGGFMISSIPDIMRPVMVHGITATFRDGIMPFARSFASDSGFRRMALDELRDAAIGWEMVIDSRSLSIFDIGSEGIARGTKGEQAIQGLSGRMSQVSLLSQWNRAAKQFSGVVTQARMLRGMEAIVSGKATKKEINKLAQQGIDAEAAVRMHSHFKQHGQNERGFLVANSDEWGEGLEGIDRLRAEADAKLFRGATLEEVNKIIVTPGVGDRPLWTSTEWGKTLFQYKSFALAATNRVMISGLQQGDWAAASGAFLMVGMGMTVAAIKTIQAGKGDDLKDWNAAKWVGEGVDRSGLIGIFSDVNAIAEKMDLGYSRLHGQDSSSRFQARNTLDAMGGPTVGMLQTLTELGRQAGQGALSQGDIHKIRRMWPYQNVFWARDLFDWGEAKFNEIFDVPERTS